MFRGHLRGEKLTASEGINNGGSNGQEEFIPSYCSFESQPKPMRMWIWSFFRCNTKHKALHFLKYSRDLERERRGWLGPCGRLGKGGDLSWTQKLNREAKEGQLRQVSCVNQPSESGIDWLEGTICKGETFERVSQGPTWGSPCETPMPPLPGTLIFILNLNVPVIHNY